MPFKKILLALAGLWLVTNLHAAQPALVLQITVDQLRGGMLEQSSDRFGLSGIRYLLDKGTVTKLFTITGRYDPNRGWVEGPLRHWSERTETEGQIAKKLKKKLESYINGSN